MFLPAAGIRAGATLWYPGEHGRYWTSTSHASTASNAHYVSFTSSSVQPNDNYKRNRGCSVRLVKECYDINYNANGGSGTVASQTKVNGINLTLTTNVFTRDGYTFAGWNTKADGSGTSYTAGASYTANAAVTLYAQWTKNEVTLSDGIDNSTAISTSAASGKIYAVTLTRTLQTGGWNTFCVPFDLDTPTGWTVKELESSSFADGTLTLNFATAESIKAGKPYLVKVDATEEKPTFEGVIVTDGSTTTETDCADFVPVINPTFLTGGDKSVLFVTGGNTLTYPSADGNINGFRAYFQLKGDTVAEARAFHMSFDDEATGISLIPNPSPKGEGSSYNLSGQRVKQPVQKGVYVVSGKKVIIK